MHFTIHNLLNLNIILIFKKVHKLILMIHIFSKK